MPKTYSQPKLTIKQWSEDDQPREKLISKGKSALSNAELIAILIGSGNTEDSAVELSKQILDSVKNNLTELGKKSVADLMRFKGIGEAKAVSIVAAMELGRRRLDSEPERKSKVTSSKDVYEMMGPLLMDLPHEEFWVLMLNRANQVIKKERISAGGVNGTVADVRIIFKLAVDALSSGIILVHNHPSGNIQPSAADKQLTQKLKEAGKLLDVPVLDHVIFGEEKYFSFTDEGII